MFLKKIVILRGRIFFKTKFTFQIIKPLKNSAGKIESVGQRSGRVKVSAPRHGLGQSDDGYTHLTHVTHIRRSHLRPKCLHWKKKSSLGPRRSATLHNFLNSLTHLHISPLIYILKFPGAWIFFSYQFGWTYFFPWDSVTCGILFFFFFRNEISRNLHQICIKCLEDCRHRRRQRPRRTVWTRFQVISSTWTRLNQMTTSTIYLWPRLNQVTSPSGNLFH